MSGHMTITSRGSSVVVLGQGVQDRVADHLDLARPAVTGVDLDRAVGGVQRRRADPAAPGSGAPGAAPVGADVVLDAAQQPGGGRPARWTCR